MHKIIFLDIDGVLNVEVYLTAFWDICKRINLARPAAAQLRLDAMRDEYGNLFCPLAVRRLAWITEATGAKIVIFDDDNDMLPEQSECFIQTDEAYGITLKDAEKAIQILNRE